ncbi:lipoyl synthase 2 protein [Artemisia annua]|uniref:Lipoyl synthase 2 protein n=1 Tax=Artemisia annua TaxID=35608 RepID=A0A2U1L3Y6_ARTAN|nr:lipoyl synthase 2 protein [Artemisia annua]
MGWELRLDVPTPTNENVLSLYCSVHYIVLISVDHDDLPDGGSGHFVEIVRAMKKSKPEIMAECLTSDFQGDLKAVLMLANSGLDIFAHNIETVNASREIYEQSLSVLEHAKLSKEGMITKTSIMLGLGETDDELMEAMAHLRVHVQCIGNQRDYIVLTSKLTEEGQYAVDFHALQAYSICDGFMMMCVNSLDRL